MRVVISAHRAGPALRLCRRGRLRGLAQLGGEELRRVGATEASQIERFLAHSPKSQRRRDQWQALAMASTVLIDRPWPLIVGSKASLAPA